MKYFWFASTGTPTGDTHQQFIVDIVKEDYLDKYLEILEDKQDKSVKKFESMRPFLKAC
jgi:hypothetical protein